MNSSLDTIFGYRYNAVCAGRTVAACRRKTSRIEDKRRADSMADRNMGVTVYNTVGLREHGIHPVFYIMSCPARTMTKTKQIPLNGNAPGFGEWLSGYMATHVPADRVHFLSLEGAKDRYFCQVTGMHNHFAIMECWMNILLEGVGLRRDMCVWKYAYSNHCKSPFASYYNNCGELSVAKVACIVKNRYVLVHIGKDIFGCEKVRKTGILRTCFHGQRPW